MSATQIGEIDRRTQAVLQELTNVRSQIGDVGSAVLQELTNVRSQIGELKLVASTRLDESKATVDDVRSAVAASFAATELLVKRLQISQLGLDALRIDHRRDADRQAASLDALSSDLTSASSTIEQGQRAGSQALIGAVQVMTEDLQKISALQLEHFSVSNVTLSRADVSLQRVAIPLGSSELLMRTEEGFLLVPIEDGALVASVWESGGRLEHGTLIVLKAILKPGDRMIDVGANIGLVSVPAAKTVGPTGHVIAMEPSSRVADLLRRSLALNGLSDRVALHQCAVGDKGGKALLNLALPVGHSSLLPLQDSKRSEEVDVRRLDDLVQSGLPIRCVKIDVEGFEPQVWRGMQRIIAENPDLIVIVEFGPEHLVKANISIDDWIVTFLLPGFSAYEIDESDGSLRPLRARHELHNVVTLNLLLIRQPAAVLSTLNFR